MVDDPRLVAIRAASTPSQIPGSLTRYVSMRDVERVFADGGGMAPTQAHHHENWMIERDDDNAFCKACGAKVSQLG